MLPGGTNRAAGPTLPLMPEPDMPACSAPSVAALHLRTIAAGVALNIASTTSAGTTTSAMTRVLRARDPPRRKHRVSDQVAQGPTTPRSRSLSLGAATCLLVLRRRPGQAGVEVPGRSLSFAAAHPGLMLGV